MAKALIPVDLFNPGQVFACMGFLEAADVLLGNAVGGFDWPDASGSRFEIQTEGTDNPFGIVLEFLTKANLRKLAPKLYADSAASVDLVLLVETFPAPQADQRAIPVRLEHDGHHLDVTHWCDGSSRSSFKLFAGQQRSDAITEQMLEAIKELWCEKEQELVNDPFGLLAPLSGSSFKFDPRKSWTGIDAGYSPDEQSHWVEASPVVEMLAAIGLEHARPDEFDTREVRYGIWRDLLPPVLARPALAAVRVGVPGRVFRFTLDLAGKNKIVTFAQEEII